MQRYRNTDDYDNKKCSTDEEDTGRVSVKKLSMRKESWTKKGHNAIGDGAEIRSQIFNTLLKKPPAYITTEELNNSSSEAGSTKQQWRENSQRLTSSYIHDDEVDNYAAAASNRTYLRNSGSKHSKLSFTQKPQNEELSSAHKQNMTPTLLMRSASFRPGSNSLFHENQINYVTLFGFAIGLLVSKLLQYLLVYFNWLLRQVKQLRNVFLGEGSIMDFFNFDDNSRYDLRVKLLIMPILAICCFLYFFVAILHYGIRLLLTDVPAFLIAMLQRVFFEF